MDGAGGVVGVERSYAAVHNPPHNGAWLDRTCESLSGTQGQANPVRLVLKALLSRALLQMADRLAPAAAAASSSGFARRHGTRFVDHQRPAHHFLAVATVDGLLRGGVIVDLDETEAAGLAGKAIAHDGHGIDRHAIISKEVL